MRAHTIDGAPLKPGVNVDRINIAAGLVEATTIGYIDKESQMVVEYALIRWGRGEEDGALRSFMSGGIDLTAAYRIIAAAAVAGATASSG